MNYKPLKDIARITMGQSPDSSSYNESGEGLPFFQGNADFGEIYPTERVWCCAPKKIAKPGDILISVRAPIGALNYARTECCIGRGLAALSIEDQAERNYIYHLLRAKHSELNRKGTGSTFKAIGKAVLEEIQVPIVSAEEQQQVMQIMDSAERIIGNRKKELQHLDKLIKARFVEMFGSIKEGRFPKCKLREVAHIKHGFAFSGEFFSDEDNGVVLVTPGNFALGGGFQETKNRYYTSDYSTEYILHPGDLIVTMTDLSKKADTLGYGAIVPNTEKVYLHNQRIGLFDQLDERLNPVFVRWYMQTDEYRLEIVRTSTGSTVHHTSPDRILNSVIYLPPLAKQKEFVVFAEQVDKSKVAVQKSMDETQLLFDSLMQQYFG